MDRLHKLGAVASAVAIGAVLTVAGAGIAAANSAGPHQGASPAQHATAAKTAIKIPCFSTWAVVNKAGTLERAGCPGTTSEYLGNGYQVLFNRNVRHCAYVATAGNAGSMDVPTPAVVSVAGRLGHVNGVFVSTVNLMGGEIQRGFDLIVECKQPKV